jgi:hypothetical protein
MTTTTYVYGTPVAVSIALDGMAPSGLNAQRSTPVTSPKGAVNYEIAVTIVGGANLAPNAAVQIYLYTSGDNGTTWETGASTSASIPLQGSERMIASLPVPSVGTAYKVFTLSDIARAANFVPPRDWGILVSNMTGAALGVGCSITVRDIQETQA